MVTAIKLPPTTICRKAVFFYLSKLWVVFAPSLMARLNGLCDESLSRFNIELPFECLRLLDLRLQNIPRVFNNYEITESLSKGEWQVFTLCYLNNDEIKLIGKLLDIDVFTLCYLNNDEILKFHCVSMRSLCMELQSGNWLPYECVEHFSSLGVKTHL